MCVDVGSERVVSEQIVVCPPMFYTIFAMIYDDSALSSDNAVNLAYARASVSLSKEANTLGLIVDS